MLWHDLSDLTISIMTSNPTLPWCWAMKKISQVFYERARSCMLKSVCKVTLKHQHSLRLFKEQQHQPERPLFSKKNRRGTGWNDLLVTCPKCKPCWFALIFLCLCKGLQAKQQPVPGSQRAFACDAHSGRFGPWPELQAVKRHSHVPFAAIEYQESSFSEGYLDSIQTAFQG